MDVWLSINSAQLVNATTTDRDLSVRVNPRKMIPLIERGRTVRVLVHLVALHQDHLLC